MKICPACGKVIREDETYTICSVCRRNYHRSCGRCPAHPTAAMMNPTSSVRVIRRIPPTISSSFNPAGFWGTVMTIAVLGGGMGCLLSTGALSLLWRSDFGIFLGDALLWSIAPLAYIFTRRPSAAFFTEILCVVISPLVHGYLNEGIFLFGVISAGTLAIVFNRFKHRAVSVRVIMTGTVCAGIVTDIFAFVVWSWHPSFAEWVAGFLGSVFAAPVAITIGKIFRKC